MCMLYSRKHTVQSVCGSNGLDDGWPQLAVAGKTMGSDRIRHCSAPPPSLRLPSRGPCTLLQNCSRKHPQTRQGIYSRTHVSIGPSFRHSRLSMDAIALFAAAATCVQDIGRSGEPRLLELMARWGFLEFALRGANVGALHFIPDRANQISIVLFCELHVRLFRTFPTTVLERLFCTGDRQLSTDR